MTAKDEERKALTRGQTLTKAQLKLEELREKVHASSSPSAATLAAFAKAQQAVADERSAERAALEAAGARPGPNNPGDAAVKVETVQLKGQVQ